MTRRLPPLNSLRAFEAAGRHQHFTKAGHELSVSHVAISRHVKELEHWLGFKLFRRTGRGVVLTDQGSDYLASLSSVFDELLAATKSVVEATQDDVLRVTSDPALAFQWLIKRLRKFSDIYPAIQVSVDPNEDIVDFIESDFDVGIRFGSGVWEGVEAIEIHRPNLFPVCSPEYLAGRKSVDLAGMAAAHLLHDDSFSMWRDWLKAVGVRRKRGASEATFEKFLALAAAESGLGFALGDELLCIEALKRGALVRPLERSVSSNKSYYLVFPEQLGYYEAVQNFAAWLSTEVENSISEFLSLGVTIEKQTS
ncbi:LysR substrate-binding domain-containing protein [Roseibium sediminicola]|uniref:LysR substrate-binding domain-containing protein n=1 Tax=Roseibium sediminicola TaxID=2933272 RepID=A0ABT0GZU1_9HYPH|nr:LysR substrate-binding domain-containing protein [Roseibium sp. CAU 1639]MCK7614948.1 LysR substrate-binding domain-containing protein [Roseibium sp. CAU 1639]